MKKVTSILLLLLFFLGTTGMPLNAHYCGDVLASLTIATQDVDDTDCCGDNDDCCSDQEVKIDVDKDYMPGASKQVSLHADFALLPNFQSFILSLGENKSTQIFRDYAPPEFRESTSFQVLHCTFLI